MKRQQHLTAHQVSEWFLGNRSLAIEQHVHRCRACHEELTNLGGTLVQFRGAVREWTEEQRPVEREYNSNIRPVAQRRRFQTFYWALAVLTLCLFAGLSVRRTDTNKVKTQMAAIDTNLLKQVDQDVSRTVPGPMEPLMQLVSWDGSTASDLDASPLEKKQKVQAN